MNFWGTAKEPHDKEKKKEKHKEQAGILKEIHAILEIVESHETQMDILIDKVSELEEDNEKKETEIRRLRARIILAESQLGIQEDE
jgi:predicted RNase H-like nuclease (RuvC/YqgF family)